MTDNHNATDSETITVTVNDENSTPVLDSIGNRGVDELTELTFTAVASDSDYVSGVPDSLNFTLINTPPNGASIHLTTGVFSWTPTEEQDGEHLVTIEVMDNSNADNIATTASSEPFMVTVAEVNDAPTLDMIGLKNATASMPLTFTATASDEDIIGGDADSLTFSLGSDDMTGANITSVGSFSWTPTATQAGEHTIRIQVTDSGNATAYEDVTVTVTGPTENLVAPPLEGSFVTTWATASPGESIYIPVADADHQYACRGILVVGITGVGGDGTIAPVYGIVACGSGDGDVYGLAWRGSRPRGDKRAFKRRCHKILGRTSHGNGDILIGSRVAAVCHLNPDRVLPCLGCCRRPGKTAD